METALSAWLEALGRSAHADLEARNAAREEALRLSRELIRLCAHAIRAGHREQWEDAFALLAQAEAVGQALMQSLKPYPDLFYAGYAQDALKELVEAQVTLAIMAGRPLPPLEGKGIPYNTCLNGVCEAASELRRRCLDLMRRDRADQAEMLLAAMDAIYDLLISFGYPDAITGGLRRRVDQLRGVLERTRGDLTHTLQVQRLLRALHTLENGTQLQDEGVAG